jgi:tetratricopeptide (TPR) repeat protein
LFGREEIVEEVDRLLGEAKAGHGHGLLLVGSNGGGKTHVLRALVARASERGFRVAFGHALPEELPSPFSLVRELLEAIGAEEVPASADVPKGSSLPLALVPFGEDSVAPPTPTPNSMPRTRAALDDLERILAPVGPSQAFTRIGASREGLVGRVEEYFLNVARTHPLLIAIDDLHLTDGSSLEFLSRFAIDLPETPVALIATVGSGTEIPVRTRSALEALGRSPAFRSVPLRPLTVAEATEFVRWIYGGREPDPHDVLRWHAQSEGNPLLIEQLVRIATGFDGTVGQPVSAESRDVMEILSARVEALAPNDQRVLTYAAVLSKEFEFSDLAAVAGLEEERVTESLDRLVQAGLLREKGHEVYEFVTEALRAHVYASLTETRRRILHQKAARSLEAKGKTSDSELARQFFLGHESDRAVQYSVAAAQSATRAFAFETAVAHLARAVEAERQKPNHDVALEIRLLTEEGRLLNEIGDPHRSDEVLSDAVAVARANPGHGSDLARALLGLAQSRYLQADYPKAEALVREALYLIPKGEARRDLMAAERILGLIAWRRGDLDQAEAHQRAVLEIAEDEGTPLEQGHALIDVANLLVFTPQVGGRYQAALDLYARAAAIFEEGGDLLGQARAFMNRAVLDWEAGRTSDALKDFPLAIAAAERARSPRWIGWCCFNLAQMQSELGDTASARVSLDRAVHAITPIGDRFGELQLELTRAMIAHADRLYDAAEASYQESLRQARELRLPSETSEVLFRSAQLSHDRGDDPEARKRLAEALALGILGHRPDFAPRIEALEKVLSASHDPGA